MIAMSDYPELSYLCKLIHESLQLPVFCQYTESLQEELYWSKGIAKHPFLADPVELFRSVVEHKTELNGPIVHLTNYMEQFAVVPVKRNGRCLAVIVIGPTIRKRAADYSLSELFNEQGMTIEEQAQWNVYLRNLQSVDQMQCLHICVSANWMVNQEALDITDVIQMNLQYEMSKKKKQLELELADWREYSIFQEGIATSSQLLDFIRQGNKAELMKQLIQFISNVSEIGVQSSRSQLRSVKNLAICGITLSSRAATEGGVDEELTAKLCDLHIRHVEELNDLALVEAAVVGAILDFTERVSQIRANGVSKAVQLSKEFIYLHLFEEISMQQLAAVSGLNPHYLSQLFKKETGLTLINYIQRERVEEAKKLLDHSNDTISAIGARLAFYDQAHFIKVFKKHAGITPKQYRNRNRAM
ncbi:AraC family transcriptional regulator [Paenibacillus montaniterrae]|uniref:AraC family transcriptional regulator n=1 Tax=Paenibacillus montaniterrae TaxID=429341 RepID=A0A919YLI5_9BACL|nr:helix-turn-helix domain-containing protein [Paenibacillus montaniterrae]GIP16093.1 AraC family transcriptional regulator [Paenibacillus montaniterrae]